MKVKRTYILSPAAIATVKRLVEVDHVAPSQDALVEHAIAELDRLVRDARDARLWSQAPHDPAFQAELRKTLEQRRARRTRSRVRPPNVIVPWLMPPALIIRATPEVHDEVQSLFWLLRRSR